MKKTNSDIAMIWKLVDYYKSMGYASNFSILWNLRGYFKSIGYDKFKKEAV